MVSPAVETAPRSHRRNGVNGAIAKAAERPHTLVINADNGPQNNRRPTQWLHRPVELSNDHGITNQLASPPYHSKYNPVDRLWDILKNHWRGELLTSEEKTIGLARTMTYKGKRPMGRKITKVYEAGVSLTKNAMRGIERCLQRKKRSGALVYQDFTEPKPGVMYCLHVPKEAARSQQAENVALDTVYQRSCTSPKQEYDIFNLINYTDQQLQLCL